MRSLWMLLILSACKGDAGPSVPTARLASVEAREQGRVLFRLHCAVCHGVRADGHGRREEGLANRPADFTSPVWREQATPRGVFRTIHDGKRGTPMPAWPVLSVGEIWDLTAYVLSVAEAGP